jgi:hypothetical protein
VLMEERVGEREDRRRDEFVDGMSDPELPVLVLAPRVHLPFRARFRVRFRLRFRLRFRSAVLRPDLAPPVIQPLYLTCTVHFGV